MGLTSPVLLRGVISKVVCPPHPGQQDRLSQALCFSGDRPALFTESPLHVHPETPSESSGLTAARLSPGAPLGPEPWPAAGSEWGPLFLGGRY